MMTRTTNLVCKGIRALCLPVLLMSTLQSGTSEATPRPEINQPIVGPFSDGLGDYEAEHPLSDQAVPYGDGALELVPSKDMNPKRYRELLKRAQRMFKTAYELGFAQPKYNQLVFLTEAEMRAMASLGRNAVPHYLDGIKIVQGMQGAGSVLEFVNGSPGTTDLIGCPVCRSYYNSAVNDDWQSLIFAHVAGHNEMQTSMFSESRLPEEGGDNIGDSALLGRLMESIMDEDPSEEDNVNLFYQLAGDSEMNQDIWYGTYQSPADLTPDDWSKRFGNKKSLLRNKIGNTSDLKMTGWIGRNSYANPSADISDDQLAELEPTLPTRATRNINSALVAFFKDKYGPNHYKSQMMDKIEKMNRPIPFVVNTKFLNEGFATISEEVIPRNTKEDDNSNIWFNYGELSHPPSLTDPYWLGLEAWLQHFERTTGYRVEDLGKLSDKERFELDKKYKEDTDHIRKFLNSAEFFKMAFDQKWVEKYGFYLSEPIDDYNEWDYDLAPSPNPDDNYQYRVTSTSVADIVQVINEMVAEPRKWAPGVQAVNFKDNGFATFRQENYRDYPMERRGLAQKLYQYAVMMDQPVRMKTFATQLWDPALKVDNYWNDWFGWFGPWYPQPNNDDRDHTLAEMEVRVYPDGRVDIDVAEPLAYLKDVLESQYQVAVDEYKADLIVGFSSLEKTNDSVTRLAAEIADSSIDTVFSDIGSLSYSPMVSKAMESFSHMVKKRLRRVMELIASGKAPLLFGKRGVQAAILPIRPNFEYDQKVINWIDQNKGKKKKIGQGPMREQYAALQKLMDEHGQTFNQPPSAAFMASLEQTPEVNSLFTHAYNRKSAKAERAKQAEITKLEGSKLNLTEKKAPDMGVLFDPYNQQSIAADPGVSSGDVVWGPNPDGQGGGKGKGDPGGDPNEPSDGEPGSGDQNLLPIPDNVVAELLSEVLELPNLQSRRDAMESEEAQKDIAIQKQSGVLDVRKTARKIIRAKGYPLMLALYEEELAKDEPDEEILEMLNPDNASAIELFEQGIRTVKSADMYRSTQEPQPSPDIEAVVVLARDASGSMMGPRTDLARKFAKLVKLLIEHQYPQGVTFEYFLFDTVAERVETEEEFWTTSKWGGTSYEAGAVAVRDRLKEAYEGYDKFVVVIGDGETWDGAGTVSAYADIVENCRNEKVGGFVSTVVVKSQGVPDFIGPLETFVAEEPWASYVNLQNDNDIIPGIKKTFSED